MLAVHRAVALAPLPKVPSAVVIFKSVVSTTADGVSSTFNDVDIGLPHKKRLVILAGTHAANSAATLTVNGISHFFNVQDLYCNVFACMVPTGTTATIVVGGATGSIGKAYGVYVAYPNNYASMDGGGNSAGGTTAATVPDIKCQAGGFMVYAGAQFDSPVVLFNTLAWEGIDVAVEDADQLVDSTETFASGHMNITQSSDLDNASLNTVIGSTKRCTLATWGPPPPGN